MLTERGIYDGIVIGLIILMALLLIDIPISQAGYSQNLPYYDLMETFWSQIASNRIPIPGVSTNYVNYLNIDRS